MAEDDSSVVLVIVMKVPVWGKSKTRLVPAFGSDNVLELAKALAVETLRRFASSELPSEWRRVVYFAPAEAEADLEKLEEEAGRGGHYEHVAMRPHDLTSSDLGSLLHACYDQVVAGSSDPKKPTAIFVGSDAPDLPAAAITSAAEKAIAGTAVVHDATDGGYVLCALPPTCPGGQVFDDVEWSTKRTAASQRAALRRCGLTVAPPFTRTTDPPVWEDVDEEEDVHSLAKRLEKRTPGLCPTLDVLLPKLIDYRNEHDIDASFVRYELED